MLIGALKTQWKHTFVDQVPRLVQQQHFRSKRVPLIQMSWNLVHMLIGTLETQWKCKFVDEMPGLVQQQHFGSKPVLLILIN